MGIRSLFQRVDNFARDRRDVRVVQRDGLAQQGLLKERADVGLAIHRALGEDLVIVVGGTQGTHRRQVDVLDVRGQRLRGTQAESVGSRGPRICRLLSQGQLCGSELGRGSVMCRPKPASRVAPKRPSGEPAVFLFRFYVLLSGASATIDGLAASMVRTRW